MLFDEVPPPAGCAVAWARHMHCGIAGVPVITNEGEFNQWVRLAVGLVYIEEEELEISGGMVRDFEGWKHYCVFLYLSYQKTAIWQTTQEILL